MLHLAVKMARCRFCVGLSISGLIELAEQELSGHYMPQRAFYQHHSSIIDLESSAHRGCDFCTLIIECFKGTPSDSDRFPQWPATWTDPTTRELENSMWAVAKELPASDIKICINSSNISASEDIDQVRVFDTLLIHVGPIEEINDDGNSSSFEPEVLDWEWNPLYLTLTVPRGALLYERMTKVRGFNTGLGEPIAVGNYRVGRFQPNPDLGSQVNHDLAKSWLNLCRTYHESCLKSDSAELPTRVIDIGADCSSESPRIIHSQGKVAPYVVLSHCWGGKISTTLTSKTLTEFQQHLPFHELPANFRDAITIARQLGVRYLWIDALCIVQDSKPDWEQESKRMDTVYRNAAVTISALSSQRSTDGILKNFQAPPAPRSVEMQVYPDNRDCQVVVQRLTHDECLTNLHYYAPLVSRGWTFQEALLSPRHLYYGSQQIYWSCPAGFQSADGLGTGFRTPERTYYASVSSALHGEVLLKRNTNALAAEELLVAYYHLIEEYSHRQLTFETDKFPAFSGLARLIHSFLPGDYIAGLWSVDFSRGLSWYYETQCCTHVQRYRAPSWSWAITDESVLYIWEGYRSDMPSLQLLGYNMHPRDASNPYGEIDSGSVIVQGYVKRLVRSDQEIPQTDYTIGDARYDECIDDKRDWHDVLYITGDESDYMLSVVQSSSQTQDYEIDLTPEASDDYIALLLGVQGSGFQPDAYCLILAQTSSGEDAEFQRVGFLAINGPSSAWLKQWEQRKMRLV